MRTFDGKVEGPITLTEDLLLQGMIAGDATVSAGISFVLHGMVAGDLVIEPGGSAVVNGTVGGSVRNHGHVEVAGRIVGSLRNVDGGTSTVHPHSDVRGERG